MDELDRRIVAELTAHGRISQQELAARLKISRPAAARRLARILTEAGASVIAMVHPEVHGLTVMAHVQITTNGPVEQIAQRIAADPGIPFVSITAGRMSLVAEIRVHNQSQLQERLSLIRAIPGVVSTQTATYSDLVMDVLRPYHVPDPHIDETDRRLIELLQRNGRASYTLLAESVGIAPGTARVRVTRMLEERIVKIGVIWQRTTRDGQLPMGIGIRTTGAVAGMAKRLASLNATHFLAATIGQYDFIATVDGPGRDEALALLNTISAMPEVIGLETWVHLKVVKEDYHQSGSMVPSTEHASLPADA